VALLREDYFQGFLQRRLNAVNGVLIHGGDQSAVGLLSRDVQTKLGGESQRMDIAACKAEPRAFLDQFLSLSLLGDRQILLVDPADDSCFKFLEPVVTATTLANFVILQADSLGKSSKLRMACEESPLFASLAVYEEDEVRLRARVAKILATHSLTWAEGAEDQFFSLAGDERALATQEAEKLALYALGQKEVSVPDVVAVCGNTSGFDADDLIDAILGGDLEASDRLMQTLEGDTRSFFPLLQLHLSKLEGLRLDMERGLTADMAVRGAKPPVFFKRKGAMLDQLRRLSLEDVMDMQASLQRASLDTRKQANLAPAIASRALLSLARLSRARG
jgi:DNA polymerase III subunit delta